MTPRIDLACMVAALVVGGLTPACGAKTLGAGGGANETGEDSGVGTTDSGIGTGAIDGGSGCVDLEVATSDLSCGSDQDCSLVRTGKVCSGQCSCGNTPVNAAAATRFQSNTASLTLEACPCAFPGEARCLGGQCALCGLGPNQPAGCNDAGAPTYDASDAPADASKGETGASDARGDATPSIAEACVDGGQLAQECVLSWSLAQNPSFWCPKMNTLYFSRVTRETNCSGYNVLSLGGQDSAALLFYSAETGALVGIGGTGNFGPVCLAGQCPNISLLDCSDGGAEIEFFCASDGGVSD